MGKFRNRVAFQKGDATDLIIADNQFDSATTIHVAINIPAKDKIYEQARRVVMPGKISAVDDVLQGGVATCCSLYLGPVSRRSAIWQRPTK